MEKICGTKTVVDFCISEKRQQNYRIVFGCNSMHGKTEMENKLLVIIKD